MPRTSRVLRQMVIVSGQRHFQCELEPPADAAITYKTETGGETDFQTALVTDHFSQDVRPPSSQAIFQYAIVLTRESSASSCTLL